MRIAQKGVIEDRRAANAVPDIPTGRRSMFKTFTLAASALAMSATALVPVAADAQRYRGGYERGYDRGGYDGGYRSYRGNDRGYYNRRRGGGCDNSGGTIVGALAGGLLGHTVAGRGDRTLGAVLGAAGGALAGNVIDKSDNPRYCRR
jgi:hypothetical protein